MAVPLDIQRIRDDFPILKTRLHEDRAGQSVPLVFLDNAASTQRPRQVIGMLAEVYERHYANVHRGIHSLSERSTELFEAAREKVRAFLNARDASDIIFTRGTTEGINLVARSWGDATCRPGDEILLSEMEHHANIVPWHQLAARTGAVVRLAPITDDGRLMLDALEGMISERTRLVALTAVSNVLGTINPLARIIERAKQFGAVTLVDAAQSVPHLPTDVQALGCDFLAFSGHKMLGPTGIGVLYGRRELLETIPPFMGGGGMIRRVTAEGFEPAELPAKFEAGTPPIAEAIALATAIDYLQDIGLDAIHQHELHLASLAQQQLAAIDGIRLLGPSPDDDDKAGIVSFVLEHAHAHDVAQVLDHHGVAVRAGHHCTMPLHQRLDIAASVRASFYLYNTPEEVRVLTDGVAAAKKLFDRRRR